MRKTAIWSITVALAALPLVAAADTTPQTLPFSQNWSNTGMITTADDWSGVPGIVGFRGDNLTVATGVDPQTVTAADDPGVIDVNPSADPNTFISGGVSECDALADPVVALQGSGTADAPYIQIYLTTIGKGSIHITYNLRDVDGSTDNTNQQFALQYRIGNSGTWTNVPGAYVADASSGPSLATLVTPVNVTLPSNADDKPEVQVRIITTNAASNDEWVGIDDISITNDVIIAVEPKAWSSIKALYR